MAKDDTSPGLEAPCGSDTTPSSNTAPGDPTDTMSSPDALDILDARARPRTALWSEIALDETDRRGPVGRSSPRDPRVGEGADGAFGRLVERMGGNRLARTRPWIRVARRRRATLAVLGAFAIVGVGVGAFVGASRGDAPLAAIPETPAPETPAPETPAPETPDTEAPLAEARGPRESVESPTPDEPRPEPDSAPSAADLVAMIPGAPAARCRPAPALDQAAGAAVVCDLDAPVDRLELRSYGTASLRSGRFAELAGSAPKGSGGPRCARGRAEVRTWSHRSAPAVVAGVYACRVRDGVAEIIWTDDALGILGVVRSEGPDLAALFGWWRTEAPGATPAPVVGGAASPVSRAPSGP